MSLCRTGTHEEVENSVLKLVRPSRLQTSLLYRLYNLITSCLSPCLRQRGLRGEITLQGSLAKGTMLSDKWEIDVFIILDGATKDWIRKNGESLLHECLAGCLPVYSRYSEHPYVTGALMGMQADIVPIGRPEPDRLEGLGVERTPLHTEYVRKRLSPRLRDEVRLLKSFLKGIGAYGAETHVRGFSGYLAELLVIVYGSFRSVLRAASMWRPPVYIDPEGLGDERLLRKKYRDSPMIVVDPVDPHRNAAAAVSKEKLALFVAASKLYLEKPSPRFFHACQPPPPHGNPVHGWVLEVDCHGPLENRPPEAIRGRLARAARLLVSRLRQLGGTPLLHREETDETSTAVIQVLLDACILPPAEPMIGPDAWAPTERLVRFIEKRLQEEGAAWLLAERLAGARPRRIANLAEATRALLARGELGRLLSGIGLRCRVRCTECPEHSLCYPTPPWIAGLSRMPG